MLQRLSDAVDQLDIALDNEAAVEFAAVMSRLAAKQCEYFDAFDRHGLYELDHATSLQTWLRDRGKFSDRDAQRMVDTVRKLRELPAVQAGWSDGSLSTGHIDVIVANITKTTLALFAEHDEALAATLAGLDITEAKAAMRRLASTADDAVNDRSGNPEPEPRGNELFLSKTLNGRYKLNADLDTETETETETETGEMLDTALNLANSRNLQIPDRERRGDALRSVTDFFLNNHGPDDVVAPLAGQRRNRPHLHVIVKPDGRGETEDGTPIPKSTVERLMCDARVNTVRFADGQVLYYGRDQRTASDAQFNALVVRDRGCRFPGCDRPTRWTSAHHVTGWHPTNGGGKTDIDNLVLLCSHHHHAIHKPGWQMKLHPNAVLEVTDPAGRTRSTRPPGNPDTTWFDAA